MLLQEKKNGIELFVSSDRRGTLKPRSAEDVIQSLNVRILHRHLGHFGITEVSTEVCVCVFDVRVPPSSFMKFANIVTISIGHDRNGES